MLFPLIWGWQFGSSSRSLQSGDASKQRLLVLFEMKILNYAVVYKQLQETFPTVNLQFFLKVTEDVCCTIIQRGNLSESKVIKICSCPLLTPAPNFFGLTSYGGKISLYILPESVSQCWNWSFTEATQFIHKWQMGQHVPNLVLVNPLTVRLPSLHKSICGYTWLLKLDTDKHCLNGFLLILGNFCQSTPPNSLPQWVHIMIFCSVF